MIRPKKGSVFILHFLLLFVPWCSMTQGSSYGINSIINSQLMSYDLSNLSRNLVIGKKRRRKKKKQLLEVAVSDFGAIGDGSNDDTEAFVQAWNRSCTSRSGAVLHVPEGSVYLVRPISLFGPCKSSVKLLISGTIVAPSNPDAWDGQSPSKWLYFQKVRSLVLTGGGSINGQGQQWWARSCKRNATNPCRHAPTAVTFHRITHLDVHDLNIVNSQQMHMVFNRCSRVSISRLNVIAPAKSPNTNGIHISSSKSVFVSNSTIRTGDDCISIVGNSSNIHITDIVCGPGHGISIGSLGKHNSVNQVENIQIDGAFISNTENGLRIKTWQGGRGYARNINFRNIVMEYVSNPIIIDQYYCDSKVPCQNQTSAVKVQDISFTSIRGTSATKHAIKFECSDTCACENIHLEDIRLFLESEEDPKAYCWNALGWSSGMVYPPSCLDESEELIEQNVNSNAGIVSM